MKFRKHMPAHMAEGWRARPLHQVDIDSLAGMNYNVFRSATNYEAVGVNHRALITRTLTKYPVDYALFRELLQNSADAKATSARITFETASTTKVSGATPSSIHEAPLIKMVFENNGQVFNDADWNRLKEIAKGNPDETKIGAFGVGFYSVFELTDTPLVHSGNSVMSFHFVGDELRYSKAHSEQFVQGTLIDIPFRGEGRIPDLTKFLSFATQSFSLLRLQQVKLHINDLELFEVTKHAEAPRALPIPKALNRYSYNKMFNLAELKSEQIRLDINYLNATQMQKSDLSTAAGLFSFGRKMVSSMFTSSEDPTEVTKLVCHMKRIDAVADVYVSSGFRNKMIATVLKPPSKQVHMSMLSASKLDVDRSTLKSPLSDAVFPQTFNDAKIVIGFPTKQSTGLKTHLAMSQLVPTMERTAVDMSNATVKDWNSELMYAAGIMARCVYESELEAAAAAGSNDKSSELAAYTMQRFEMAESAPDQKIGEQFAAGFWRCLKVALLPTQMGIQPSSKVRLASPDVPLSLLKNTPVITSENKNVFIEQMVHVGYLQRLTPDDVARDLEHGPIDVATFEDLVKWAQTQSGSLKRVFDATVVALKDQTLLLGQIKYYEQSEDMLPATCLPPAAIANISAAHLEKLGWKELPVQAWVQHLATHTAKPATSFVLNEQFAVQFLTKLALRWPRMSTSEQTAVREILRGQACIPTQKGMQLPGQAYIKPIALFPELPVISISLDLPLKFYKALGLRESVDMKFVLKALHESDLKWSSEDLVGYLVEHQKQLGTEDWNVLRQGKFFEQAGTGKLMLSSQLYLPSAQLEQMGFDVLKWKNWQAGGQAEKLLLKLQMRRAPSALELFEKASATAQLEPALKYYFQQYDTNEYSASTLKDTNFRIVPTKMGRASPRNCYFAPESELFGLEVVRGLQEFQSDRLGVRRDPPANVLVAALAKKPPTLSTAPQMFGYLSSRLSQMTSADIDALRKLAFIPVGKTLQRPENVFFSGPDSELNKLFCIVQATPGAKPFLQRVGVQECPSTTQIAWKIVENPGHVYELVASSQQYAGLLYRLQTEWATISRDKALVGRMKVSSFLLCEQRDENNEASLVLSSASEIKIVDNVIIYNQFKHLIKACPQETALEEFYSVLGARNLSESLLERCTMGKSVQGDPQLEAHVKERLTVFLESTSKKRRMKNASHLSLAFVSSINLERKLAETPAIKVATTAYMLSSDPNKLYLMPQPDWFDVSSVLARHCLQRPDPESVIVLELQLGSTLESLQRKGYNVTRLLKQQQEARDEKLRQRLGKEREERLRLEEAEIKRREEHKLQQEQRSLERELKGEAAPAAIEAAARAPAAVPAPAAPPALPSIPLPETSGSAPPPMASIPETASSYLSKLFKGSKGPSKATRDGRAPPGAPQLPTPQPHTALPTDIAQGQKEAIESTLDRGVQCSCPWTKDTQAGAMHQDAPPSLNVPLKCDGGRSTDLKVGAKLNDGTRVFIDRHAPPLSESQMASAVQFSTVLYTCCQIYQVPYSTLAIFVGDLELIAYNTSGSLFFNLGVYENRCSQGWTQGKHLDFWFTVMAHELAHNLVQDHGSSHSYFTEMYIAEKLSKLRKLQ